MAMPLTPSQLLVMFLTVLVLPLRSQTAPPPPVTEEEKKQETQVMEAFVVTGSNIRRIDVEKTMPITSFDADDIDMRGGQTPAEFFDSLSIGGPLSLDEGNLLGADARGDNVSLNLRGIGSGNTLMLLNGRRMPPHPISQAESGVPSLAANFNQLPAAATQRVDVLRDGAAAIYGTDAAAGVVNTQTRRSFDGYQVRSRGSVTQHGGASDWNVEVTTGQSYNKGRTHAVVTLDYYHRDMLGMWDREYTRDADIRLTRNVPPPWDGGPTIDTAGTAVRDVDFNFRSDNTNYGSFTRGTFDSTGTFAGARPTTGVLTTGTTGNSLATMSAAGVFFLIPMGNDVTGFRTTTPLRTLTEPMHDWWYNPNPARALLPRSDRLNFTAMLRHQLNAKTEAFAEIITYRAKSVTIRQPNGFDAATDHNIYVGRDNPYNPFGSRFYSTTGAPNADGSPRITGSPSEVLITGSTGVLPRDFQPRSIDVLSESFRGVTGLRGRLGEKFEWETALLYGRSTTNDREHFAVRESRLRAALTSSDPTKAFNPFGYTFKLAPQTTTTNPWVLTVDKPFMNATDLVNSLYDTFEREGRTELASWDVRTSGSLFDFSFLGGPIGVAGGGEWRWESYKDWRPLYAGLNPASTPFNGNVYDPTNLFFGPNENDFIAISPNNNLYSARTVLSAYGEVLVPIVAKRNALPLVRLLELSLAGRIERFSDFGSTAKPKAGLSWRPAGWLQFRGSANQSFRAPNLVQTNTQPLQRAVSGVSDDYRSTVTNLAVDSNATRTVYRQGSGSLTPESSKSLNLGVVLSVPFYRNLTFTVDYFRIRQTNVINDITASEQLVRDEELLDAAVQAQLAAGKAIGQIDLGSGTANYLGNPQVKRAGVTPDDITRFTDWNASHPAAQQRAPVGSVVSVITDYINMAGRSADGFDFGFDLRLPKSRWGQFAFKGDATLKTKYEQITEPGAAPVSYLSRDGRVRFRGSLGAIWRQGRWTASWYTTYFGPYFDTDTGTTKEVYDVLGHPEYISKYQNSTGAWLYRYLVTCSVNHNATLTYAFPKRRGSVLNDLSVRLGVNNVFDAEPPLGASASGYQQGAGTNPRGRVFSGQISKHF